MLGAWLVIPLLFVLCLTVVAADDERISPNASRLENFEGSNLDDAIRAFQVWFERGYKGIPKVRLGRAGDGMRLGVFATQMIAPESLYLSLPLEIIIGETTIFPTPVIGPLLRKLQNKFSTPMNREQTTLALFLLHQKFIAGEHSFWKEYIDLIPTKHDIPEFYSPEELKLLKGTYIENGVLNARTVHRQEYEWLKLNVFATHKDELPTDILTYERFAWAKGILNTRMIWWDGQPHLVPMLDMINCRQGPNPYRVHSTRREKDHANTYAPWRFEVGDQIFENYGQPNPTYYFYHGFVMIPNVHDCATIRIMDNAKPKYIKKLHEFRLFREESCVHPEKYGDALAASRIIVAADGELAKMHKPPNTIFSYRNERRALKFLDRVLKERIDLFPPFDPSWNSSGVLNASPFRQRQAITFRETQRGLLVSTSAKLRRLAASVQHKRDEDKDDGEKGRGRKDEL